MIKIQQLKEIVGVVKTARHWEGELLVVDILTEETIDRVFDALPKLLDLYDSAQVTYHGVHDLKDCAICKALEGFEK